jgi:hypothetical protein
VLVEAKAVDDVAYVRGELVDVTVQVWRELIWVIEQLFKVELLKIIEWPLRNLLQQTANDGLRLFLYCRIFFEHRSLCGGEQTVKSAQDG